MAGEGVPPGNIPPPHPTPAPQGMREIQAMLGNMMLEVAAVVSERLAVVQANQFSAPVVVMRGDPETGDMKEEKTSVAQLLAEIADDVAYIADACGEDEDEDEPSNGRKRGMDKGKKKRGR